VTKRFTSGGAGRFTFDVANRALDAAERAEANPYSQEKVPRLFEPRPIVARLLTDRGTTYFQAGANGQIYRVFDWEEIGSRPSGASRVVGTLASTVRSDAFGTLPRGRAIALGGQAATGDIVTLFRMQDETGEGWYGFVGKTTASTATGAASVLNITSSTEILPGRYRYQVTPIRIDAAGQSSPNPGFASGVAWNLYELSDRHGQELEFDNPASRLIVAGPVEGPVLGVLSSAPGDPVTWCFEAPQPLEPECGAPPGVDPALNLKEGI
jgi:hypothetical protein